MVLLKHASRDLDGSDQLRAGHGAGEAVQRGRTARPCASTSSRARAGVRVSQKRVDPQTGEEVPYEEHRQGLRDRAGPLRGDRAGRAGDAAAEEDEDDRDRGLRRALTDRSRCTTTTRTTSRRDRAARSPTGCCWRRCARPSKVAIARVVIRSKEQLVAVRPMGDALGMATMLFADEVLSPERLDELADAAEVKTTKRELDIAKQLVDSLAGDFEPEKYRDTYRAEVLALIERKAQGEEIAVQPTPEEVSDAGARPDERAEGEPRGGARARRRRRAAARNRAKPPRSRRRRKRRSRKPRRRSRPAKQAAGKQAAGKRQPPSGSRQSRRQAVDAERRHAQRAYWSTRQRRTTMAYRTQRDRASGELSLRPNATSRAAARSAASSARRAARGAMRCGS